MSTALEKTNSMMRQMLDITLLEPAELNPNKMSAKEFDLLVDNLRRVGLTDPILCRPIGNGRYRIIGGHHRWEAAKFLGFKEVPVTIIMDEEFDDEAEQIQIVRHNAIHGSVAPEVFMEMYKKFQTKYPNQDLASMFGFADQKEFEKLIQQTKKSLPKEMQKAFANGVKDIKTIEGLSALLQKLFDDHGSTLPYGYMIVDYGGKDNLWIKADVTVMKSLNTLCDKTKAANKNVGDVLSKLLQLIASGKLDAELTMVINQALDVEI